MIKICVIGDASSRTELVAHSVRGAGARAPRVARTDPAHTVIVCAATALTG